MYVGVKSSPAETHVDRRSLASAWRRHRLAYLLSLVALACLLFVPAPASAALPPNLTTNPGTQISGFQQAGEWTLSGWGAATVDSSQSREGSGSLQLTASTAGDRVIIDKAVSLDLSSMLSGGLVRFWVYFNPDWTTTLAEVKVRFATPTSGYDNGLCLRMAALNGMHQGWNLISAGRSDFTSGPGVLWTDPIVGVRLELWPQAGKSATVRFDDLRFGVNATPAVVISFDDGLRSIYSTAYPIMTARGLTGTAYVVSGDVGQSENATLAQLKTLYGAGWDIANHTVTHPDALTALSLARIEQELSGCASYLTANGMPRAARDVAYPAGEYNATVLQAMAATGMQTGRMVSYRPVALPLDEPFMIAASTTDPSTLTVAQVEARIDQAINDGAVIHLFFHDVVPTVTDPTYEISTANFTTICDYLVQRGLASMTISQFYNLSQSGTPVDVTPPVTTTDFDGLVHTGPVTIHLSATDVGVGVDYTEFSLDNGAHWTRGTSFTLTTSGTTLVSYRSADLAGNVEQAKTVSVTINPPTDTQPPVTTATGLQPSSSAGWSRSAVTVTLTATDNAVGVASTSYRIDAGAWTTYTAPFTISAAGRHTVAYYSTDRAANVEATHTGYVNIDTTAPTVTIQAPASGATYLLNQPVTAGWTATDALSGIATSTSTPVANGAALPTSTFGSKSFSVTATDAAGNSRTRSVTYSVPFASTGLTGINADGSSAFALGAVVPLRFALTGSNGGAYTRSLRPRLYVAQRQTDGTWGTEVAAVASPTVSGGNRFTYAGGGVYAFNLSTSVLSTGSWRLRVDLGGGGALPFGQFSLR